ncbi:MAG: CYTH domain-containing protein [Gammaproteobacteria bacterium]|nr:CYTH domain-containing protein [Gammaproteobacteria bacterium]
MAIEIERKFLLKNDSWRSLITRQASMRQGYFGHYVENAMDASTTDASLSKPPKASIRVRITGDKAFLNIKSATLGIYRKEYEYPIALTDASEMLSELCDPPLIEKTRFYVPFGQHTWEIDVFEGDNAGLVVAEIELLQVDEEFERPDWLGEEVSTDPRYYNVCLVRYPFKYW